MVMIYDLGETKVGSVLAGLGYLRLLCNYDKFLTINNTVRKNLSAEFKIII